VTCNGQGLFWTRAIFVLAKVHAPPENEPATQAYVETKGAPAALIRTARFRNHHVLTHERFVVKSSKTPGPTSRVRPAQRSGRRAAT